MKPLALLLAGIAAAYAQTGLTPAVEGPLHVEQNRLVDRTGQTILLRGTQMSALDGDLTALTPTTFSQIRQRWNMNALRLMVSVPLSLQDPTYLPRISAAVRQANRAELAVILAAVEDADPDSPVTGMPTARVALFWNTWAAYFRDNPMVLFDPYSEPVATHIPGHQPGMHSASDWQFWRNGGLATNGRQTVGMADLVSAIRSTGAKQVVVAMALDDEPLLAGFDSRALLPDPDIVYEVCPMHPANLSDAQRDQHFGFLSSQVPVLANDWDLELDQDSPDCAAIPSDPSAAADLVRAAMAYFDAHQISWTSSLFAAGKLVESMETFEPTRLEFGFTCGHPAARPAGMGHVVQFHLWGAADTDVVTVNGGSGIIVLPQDGVAISYGLDLSGETAAAPPGAPFPVTLGGISVSLTDSLGVTRLVPLIFVSPIQFNFLVPKDTAAGPASLAVLGGTGAGPAGKAFIDRVMPGLFTATANARGPVLGTAFQRAADGTVDNTPTSVCDDTSCATRPIRLSPDVSTQVKLYGTGFRNAGGIRTVEATIGGIPVPVLAAGQDGDIPYLDSLVLELGPDLAGVGETDLLMAVEGKLGNAVRIQVQ